MWVWKKIIIKIIHFGLFVKIIFVVVHRFDRKVMRCDTSRSIESGWERHKEVYTWQVGTNANATHRVIETVFSSFSSHYRLPMCGSFALQISAISFNEVEQKRVESHRLYKLDWQWSQRHRLRWHQTLRSHTRECWANKRPPHRHCSTGIVFADVWPVRHSDPVIWHMCTIDWWWRIPAKWIAKNHFITAVHRTGRSLPLHSCVQIGCGRISCRFTADAQIPTNDNNYCRNAVAQSQ